MYDVIIIGCGPAGLSAAIYTARSQLKTLILGSKEDSMLWKAHFIQNYFGVELEGKEMLEKGVEQAKKLGSEIIEAEVVGAKGKNSSFTVTTADNKEYETKTIIIATGTACAPAGIKGEKELTGKGVSYCAICDGFFYKGKKIAVVGNGNYAAHEAIELLSFTKDITIFSQGKKWEMSDEFKKALEKKKVQLRKEQITGFAGKKALEGVLIGDKEEKFDGVFVAMGTATGLSFAQKLGIQLKDNTIVIDKEGNTNVKGVFAAGNCTGCYPQVAVDVGEGAAAGLSAIKLVKGKEMHIDYCT
ncbi:NAD(P)/FAD-dependent oxidoreductase [Candidatus Woesearchaeota archaeon]|nr:NAD(P)/FAD-dependent oxidoreductase [Candidatus Woesearchaeota archaeon]